MDGWLDDSTQLCFLNSYGIDLLWCLASRRYEMIVKLRGFNCESETCNNNKGRSGWNLCCAFVSGLADNVEMSLSRRRSGNFVFVCVCVHLWESERERACKRERERERICLTSALSSLREVFWCSLWLTFPSIYHTQWVYFPSLSNNYSDTEGVSKHRCRRKYHPDSSRSSQSGMMLMMFVGALCQRGSYSTLEGRVVKIQYSCTDGPDDSCHKASSFSAR